MTDLDGSMTDRWMGVFRSVDHEPIGDARYARAQAHRRRSANMTIWGLLLVAGPSVLTVVAVWSSRPTLIGYAAVAWLLGLALGPAMLHTGFKRYRHLRAIGPGSEVEIFAGTAPAPATRAERSSEIDSVTARLMNAVIVVSGRNHRLVVHPDTGLILEVDGTLVNEFVGGDVNIISRIPGPSAQDTAAMSRPLSVLEKHELKLLGRRLTRGTWGPMLGAPSAAAAVVGLVWATTADRGAAPDVVITVLFTSGPLLLVAAVDRWQRRRLAAKLQRDSEAGLRREEGRWLLPESGICWESNGLPGPLRLVGGGLGSEADGRTRPVMF